MSLQALLTAAAFAPIENLGWLRITGEDRVRWLNGMTTNNIAALTPGQVCYTFFLNAQGRIQADATAFLLEDSILLETASPGSLATMLDHFIIMDDVELGVVEGTRRQGTIVAGPQALSLLQYVDIQDPPLSPLAMRQTSLHGAPVDILLDDGILVPRFELWSDPNTVSLIMGDLLLAGATPATLEDLEQLRVLSGTPLYGTDIRNTETHKDLPQETAQTRALHFSKGCYLGQEIVERIRSRGAVHRTFTGFTLQGELPPAQTELYTPESPEKPIGELTSIAQTPFGLFALGYLRRDALDQNKSIQYPGGTATPSALPFSIPDLKRA